MYYALLFLLVLLLLSGYYYNALVRCRVNAREGMSDIDVQLKRRTDLIPNLVEVVKGYATHERELFERVAEARSKAMQNTTDIKEKEAVANEMHAAVKSLFAVSESYPELKANQNFLSLQEDIVDTENKIQAARRFYNSVVREYNTKIEVIPSNIIASLFRFIPLSFFEIEDEEERKTPDLSSLRA